MIATGIAMTIAGVTVMATTTVIGITIADGATVEDFGGDRRSASRWEAPM